MREEFVRNWRIWDDLKRSEVEKAARDKVDGCERVWGAREGGREGGRQASRERARARARASERGCSALLVDLSATIW